MPVRSKRYGFFDLYPGVCLAPFVALAVFLAYVNFSTLAAARASVGGPWLVSALAGAAGGLALLAAVVARARAGRPLLVMIVPVVCVVAGLVICKQELWLTAVRAGRVTTAFEAGILALASIFHAAEASA